MIQFSPLDFRLTAQAQFRFLAMMCEKQTTQYYSIWNKLSIELLMSAQLVDKVSLNTQANTLLEKFQLMLTFTLVTNSAQRFLEICIGVTGLISAVHVNAFEIIRPGENQSEVISNFYPRYDNSTFMQVRANAKQKNGHAGSMC